MNKAEERAANERQREARRKELAEEKARRAAQNKQ